MYQLKVFKGLFLGLIILASAPAYAIYCENKPKVFDKDRDGTPDFIIKDCEYDVKPAKVVRIGECPGAVDVHYIKCDVQKLGHSEVHQDIVMPLILEHDRNSERGAGFPTVCKFQRHDFSSPYGSEKCDYDPKNKEIDIWWVRDYQPSGVVFEFSVPRNQNNQDHSLGTE